MARIRCVARRARSAQKFKAINSRRHNAWDFPVTRATPEMQELAKRLIKLEVKANKSRETHISIPILVIEKLRPNLSNIMGNAGFRALLSRAIMLARTEFPWLRTVQVDTNGTLGGLDKLDANVSSEDFLDGSVGLLAQLLGLLVAFIGESLTLRMMDEIWPNASLTDLEFSRKGNYEKTN